MRIIGYVLILDSIFRCSLTYEIEHDQFLALLHTKARIAPGTIHVSLMVVTSRDEYVVESVNHQFRVDSTAGRRHDFCNSTVVVFRSGGSAEGAEIVHPSNRAKELQKEWERCKRERGSFNVELRIISVDIC